MLPPASCERTPVRIFISVLLPAPFSPASPSTSPRDTCRLTRSSAFTPGNVFEILRIPRNGVMESLLPARADTEITSGCFALLCIAAHVVLRHHRDPGIDVLDVLILPLHLGHQMLHRKPPHRHRTLHHDPLNVAFLQPLQGIRQIVEREHLQLALHRAELLSVEDLRYRRAAYLAHAEDALELRMRPQRRLCHRYAFGEIVLRALRFDDLDARIFCEFLLD